jgi:outer membrane protein W
MKILRYVALVGVAALTMAPGLKAQVELDITPFTGATFFLADPPTDFALGNRILQGSEFSRSFTMGLDAGVRLNDRWAIEGMFSWLPTNISARSGLDGTADVNAYMYGLTGLYYVPLTEKVQPFFGLGVGGETFDYQIAGVDTHNEWMTNAAIGLYLRANDRFGLRFEARDCIARFKSGVSRSEDSWENDLMTTIGFSFRVPIR